DSASPAAPSAPSTTPSTSPVPATSTTNPSPTPIMTIPTECTSSVRPEFSFDSSAGTTGRLYADGEGCFTVTDIYDFLGTTSDGSSNGPIYMLDDDGEVVDKPTGVTKKWLLAADLHITG
ncbi:unnamed protein product, partial [Scytosiphon promiscuus]